MQQAEPYANGTAYEVQDSPEFQRVLGLRRRVWEDEVAHNDLYLRMTQAFKLPPGQQTLRPIQAAALADAHDMNGLLAPIRVGEGKSQPDDEPVLLEHGWTPIGDVVVGDRIYGSDGKLHTVEGVYPQGVRPVYELVFSDGAVVRSDIEHLWTFHMAHDKVETKPLSEWLQEPLFRESSGQRIWRMFAPILSAPVEKPPANLPLDPYTLGALLGDGSMKYGCVGFTTMDKDILQKMVVPDPVKAVPKSVQNCGRATDYNLVGTKPMPERQRKVKGSRLARNPLIEVLRDLDLMGCGSEKKFIPNIYMEGSADQRLELLRGLLDTDGEVAKTRSMFSSTSATLAEQVRELVEGLGGTATMQYRHNHIRVGIQLPRGVNPFYCKRKRVAYEINQKKRQRGVYRSLREIRYVGESLCTCISVSAPDRLYVTRHHVLTHNTLLTFLLPVVIPGVQRPTLLLPAALIEKTWREFSQLRKHWQCHPTFMTRKGFDAAVMSYEILGRDCGKMKINDRKPDLLIADECHKLRNRQAACTKRVERYLIAHPQTVFCGMSGTITKRSIMDYWHLLYWALKHNMPLPRHEHETEKWAEAIDERKTDAISRRGPGVLLNFCTPDEVAAASPKRTAPIGRTAQMPDFGYSAKLNAARVGYQRRFRETPGVICSPDRNLDCSLIIRRCHVDTGPVINDCLQTLRSTWTTPNGDLLALPTDIWRFAREIACGFYYRWDPPPPIHWLQARKDWNWYVRQVLAPDGMYREQFAWLNLDSPMQVANAIQDGHIQQADIKDAYFQWANVRGDYKINVVDEWLDDAMLNFCEGWMKKNGSGIVWTEHRAFGTKLAQRLRTGFCSTGGLDERGVTIEDYAGRPVVASVPANYMGRNLQAWNKNLVVTASPTGSLWEQLLGRTHRMGQEEDTVYVDWVSACDEQDQGFQQLLADARYIQDTTGQSQKLLFADRIG